MDGIVGLGGYQLNILWMLLSNEADTNLILNAWYCRVRRIPIQYSTDVAVGLGRYWLNIVYMLLLD
jgi:hypothetical protein